MRPATSPRPTPETASITHQDAAPTAEAFDRGGHHGWPEKAAERGALHHEAAGHGDEGSPWCMSGRTGDRRRRQQAANSAEHEGKHDLEVGRGCR